MLKKEEKIEKKNLKVNLLFSNEQKLMHEFYLEISGYSKDEFATLLHTNSFKDKEFKEKFFKHEKINTEKKNEKDLNSNEQT